MKLKYQVQVYPKKLILFLERICWKQNNKHDDELGRIQL